MKLRLLLSVCVLVLTVSIAQVASASLHLTPDGGVDGPPWDGSTKELAFPEIDSGNQTSNQQILNFITANWLNGSVSLYKNDNPAESGDFAAYYSTAFDLTPSQPSEFTITWDGPEKITGATHLLVKDGNQEPAWYLFDISMWDGMMPIFGFNFWPGNGAISHIEIFGADGPPGGGDNGIPEAASLIVWSLLVGSVSAVTARRRRSSRL